MWQEATIENELTKDLIRIDFSYRFTADILNTSKDWSNLNHGHNRTVPTGNDVPRIVH